MNCNDCDEMCCEMSPLDNKWALFDGYIEMLYVFIDKL